MGELPAQQIRVGDDDRERVVGALHRHAAAGRLDPEELDERVEIALRARTFGELELLTRDLPRETRTPSQAVLAHRWLELQKFKEHVGSWIVLAVITIGIWGLTGAGYFWPIWPLGFWGLGVVIHGVSLLKDAPDRST